MRGGWEGRTYKISSAFRREGFKRRRRMEEIIKLIQSLMEKNFYGELLIKFEAGKIIICKKTESIKVRKVESLKA